MLQYQKSFYVPQIRTVDFHDKWQTTPSIVKKKGQNFEEIFELTLNSFGETFNYHHSVVHDTLLNRYLLALVEKEKIKTTSKQREAVKKFKEVVKRGKYQENSKMLYRFRDGGKEYEVDALLFYELDNKEYTLMIDFKSNGKDRKDIIKFRKSNYYKRLLDRGIVYTVVATPDYEVPPCDFYGDITEAYLPSNIKGFNQEVREETKRSHKRHTNFSRNLDHKRQKFSSNFGG